MANYDFDAIVIGSGISGGWAAKELCEKGMKVLMLDRGRMVEHRKDYITEGKGPWQLAYRGNLPPAEADRDYIMAKWGGANLTAQTHFYNNDRLNPIDFENSKPFRWVRPNQVGGKSLIWGRVALRWSHIDFEANKRDGQGSPWPIDYDDIPPWYSYVESFAGIAGSKEGLPQLPDGGFSAAASDECSGVVGQGAVGKGHSRPQADPDPYRQHDRGQAGAGAYPLPGAQHVRPGLFLWRLFLDPGRNSAGRAQDRKPDPAVGPGRDQPGI